MNIEAIKPDRLFIGFKERWEFIERRGIHRNTGNVTTVSSVPDYLAEQATTCSL